MAEPRANAARPSPAALVLAQARHANQGFWRDPVAAFFTLLLPLTFLVLLGSIAGDEIVDRRGGVRLAQYLTPAVAVFAAVTASFSTLAVGVALARERGVLKRLRGTPLPAWVYLAGRVGSAVWIAALSVVLLVAVGVALYGVRPVWAALPAALVTLTVGIACFAALGLAAVALIPSAQAVQAATTAGVILLAFVSDIFLVGGRLPAWLETLGWVFPLKHFANALGDTFNPAVTAAGFGWGHLAVMAGWGIGGGLLAWWRFGWEPARAPSRRAARAGTPRRAAADIQGGPPASPRRPAAAALVLAQVRYAGKTLWRDRAGFFFSVVFPALLLALFTTVYGGAEAQGPDGRPLAQILTPALAAYGVAVAAFVNLPEGAAQARDNGILKRLRGTPLPGSAYVAGRVGAALWLGLLTVALTVAVGVVLFDVEIVWRALPAALVTLMVGVACLASLGLAVAALAPSPQATAAITLGTLLPLSFVSDVFVIGVELPGWLQAFGWLLPLKHFANALGDTFDPGLTGAGFGWGHLAVMAAWGAAGALVARRRFGWAPRAGRQRPTRPRPIATAPPPTGPGSVPGRAGHARVTWPRQRR